MASSVYYYQISNNKNLNNNYEEIENKIKVITIDTDKEDELFEYAEIDNYYSKN